MKRMKIHQEDPYLLERLDIQRKLAEESKVARDQSGILATSSPVNMSKFDNSIPVVNKKPITPPMLKV